MTLHVFSGVETGLGQLGHLLSRSTRSDLLYKISRSDLDSALDHKMTSGTDQRDGLSVRDCDHGSVSFKTDHTIRVFDHLVLVEGRNYTALNLQSSEPQSGV